MNLSFDELLEKSFDAEDRTNETEDIIARVTEEVKAHFEPVVREYEERIATLEKEIRLLHEMCGMEKGDVSKPDKLSETEMKFLCGIELEGWLIYENVNRGNFLYRVRLDGSDNQPITTYPVDFRQAQIYKHGLVTYVDERGKHAFFIKDLIKDGHLIKNPLSGSRIEDYIAKEYWKQFKQSEEEKFGKLRK